MKVRWQLDAELLEQEAVLVAQLSCLLDACFAAIVLDDLNLLELRAEVVALGFSGNAGLVETLLPFLTSVSAIERKLAGQSLSMITRVEFLDPQFVSASTDQDDASQPRRGARSARRGLPEPNAKALQQACLTWTSSKHTQGRLLDGKRYDLQRLASSLATSPLRRTQVHALALFIRSEGKLALDPKAVSHRQHDQLTHLKASRASLIEDVFDPW